MGRRRGTGRGAIGALKPGGKIGKLGLAFQPRRDHHLATSMEVVMGDKGGKKDKEKGQKQKVEKQTEKAKTKQEKQQKKP